LIMGGFAILLQEIGLNLGWVYLFMGIIIGPAVIPLWNLMTWKKASGTGAVVAAWTGLALSITSWIVSAYIHSGAISVSTLGTNEAMLTGNLFAILSSGLIHFLYSTFIDPQDYNFDELDTHITLVEDDQRGLTDDEKNPELLAKSERWIKRRGYIMTFILILAWPILSIPARIFTKGYFAFWVLLAIAWGFGAALIITLLPLVESATDINKVLSGVFNCVLCRETSNDNEEEEPLEEYKDDEYKGKPEDGEETSLRADKVNDV